ncbi:HAD family hydrolase [Candidatus Curtissbacteria bacterium]|nr:HAD family hydrolase [Candidatus Curtissbacteria bacterium]
MIKLVAFDWNGTLLADAQAVCDGCNHFISAMGVKPITLRIYREKFVVPVIDFYESIGLSRKKVLKNAKMNAQIFHKYYELRASTIRSRANTGTILKWLYQQNILTVIFSNHITRRIEEQLERLKIAKYIDGVIANNELDEALKGRNKGEKLISFAKTNDLNAKEILIVGDSSEEIEIAKEFGSISVAITHGHYSTKRLKAAKPDYLIGDLGNLINIIRNINTTF